MAGCIRDGGSSVFLATVGSRLIGGPDPCRQRASIRPTTESISLRVVYSHSGIGLDEIPVGDLETDDRFGDGLGVGPGGVATGGGG